MLYNLTVNAPSPYGEAEQFRGRVRWLPECDLCLHGSIADLVQVRVRVRVRVVLHEVSGCHNLVHHGGVRPGPGPDEEEPSPYVVRTECVQDRAQIRLTRVPVRPATPRR